MSLVDCTVEEPDYVVNVPQTSTEEPEWFDQGKTIKKQTVKPGKGLKCPRHNSKCLIIVDKLQGPLLNHVDIGFPIGKPTEVVVDECDTCIGLVVEKVLFTMRTGERCRMTCLVPFKQLAEDAQGELPDEVILQDNELLSYEFELELVAFEPQPDMHKVGDVEKYQRAASHKQKGVEIFKMEKPRKAFYRFSKAAKYLIFIDADDTVEVKEQCNNLLSNCYLNMAACQLETGCHQLAIENCTSALQLNEGCVKALYRRAVAQFKINNFAKARDDFQKVLKLEPTNSAAKNQLEKIHEAEQELEKYYAQQMKKMFV